MRVKKTGGGWLASNRGIKNHWPPCHAIGATNHTELSAEVVDNRPWPIPPRK